LEDDTEEELDGAVAEAAAEAADKEWYQIDI
jgi:hypothetical protein